MNTARHLPCLIGLALLCQHAVRAAENFNSAYLSEILAENRRGLRDEEGERSGWVEIHNGGTSSVNLGGWFLTDSATNRTQWRFPGVVLLPDKYLVVYASGKNRTNDLAHLHTNFRLSPGGSYLALVNAATNVVSEFVPAHGSQIADVSFGSVRGEPSRRGPFLRPTPGKGNSASGAGFAPAVSFSKSSGTFTDSFSVKLSCSSTNAVIRFTLDGNLPTSSAPAYSAPLLITNTVQVRARAFQAELLPGPPHSETYLKLSTNVLTFTSTLPLLIIDTLGKNVPTSSHNSFAHCSFFEPVNGRTSLTNPPTLTSRGGFHGRGSTSGGMPQQGFALEFTDEFNQELSLAPLGLPADSDWILYAPNAYDPVLIHNPFIHQLSREMGRYSSRTRFVEVFLARDSGSVKSTHYNGVYVLEEKIKIGRNRVNIDRVGAEDLKPPAVTGGYLLKFDRLGPGESGLAPGGPSMVFVEPKEQIMNLPQRAPQKEYLNSYFGQFDAALNGPNWKDESLGYRAFLDVDAAIDYHVLEVLSGNVDSMVLSAYFYKPRGGKIVCGPHWDFDRALGSTDGRDADPRQWNTGPFFSGTWWPRLFSDPDFWQRWVDRWQELRGNQFSLGHLCHLIDTLTNAVSEAQPREYEKWGLQPRGGSYQSEITLMKQWLSNRIDFIDAQLVPPPQLSLSHQTNSSDLTVSFTVPTNVSVCYTLDGSDPRVPQGAKSSNALVYAGPIHVKTNTPLVARSFNGAQKQTGGPPSSTPWSLALRTNVPGR